MALRFIGIRVSHQLATELRGRAAQEGVSLSELVRRLTIGRLADEKERSARLQRRRHVVKLHEGGTDP